MEVTSIPISKVHIGGNTQTRVKINEEVISDYLLALIEGAELPPIAVFHDGAIYWLADGFHRYWAYVGADWPSIPCHVYKGGFRDAVKFGLYSNEAHGLRRSREDKTKAVCLMLSDPEWSEQSDRMIADHCHVSHSFVGDIREKMEFGKMPALPIEAIQPGDEPDLSIDEDTEPKTTRTGKDGKKRKVEKKAVLKTDQQATQDTLWDSVSIRIEMLAAMGDLIEEAYPDADQRMFAALDRLMDEVKNHFAAWRKQLTTTIIGVRK
jgi:hypothetical protein